MVIFLYICTVKEYYVYLIYHYDDSIEEGNAVGECLSRESAEEQEKYGSWVEDMRKRPIDSILTSVWHKDDVDKFNKEHPETIKYSFLIYVDRYGYKEKNYTTYSPLSEKREEILKMIL